MLFILSWLVVGFLCEYLAHTLFSIKNEGPQLNLLLLATISGYFAVLLLLIWLHESKESKFKGYATKRIKFK